jgi:predicted O-methyltransferase YrrM
MDGIALLESLQGEQFDYIFADISLGKFDHLDLALNLTKVGGFYIIDDILPQPNWPPEHLDNFRVTKLSGQRGLLC